MGSEKSISLFEMKKRIGYLIIYWTMIVSPIFNNFSALLLCKINIFDFFDINDFFSNFCYVGRYWNSDRIKLLVGNERSIHLQKEESV